MSGPGDDLVGADDRILAGRAADGDTAAFGVLVRRHTPIMRAYVRRILGSGSADVDDAVQEAFVVAWQRLPTLEDAGKVRGWLLRIASRKALDHVRRSREEADLDAVSDLPSLYGVPQAAAQTWAQISALGGILDDLPPAQRHCWTLRELGGHSYEEIAEYLELPVSTVRGLLARARKMVVMKMEGWR